ncbi:MAG: hypothetical protein AB8G99_01290 [Planctomycetaceae bacterium]
MKKRGWTRMVRNGLCAAVAVAMIACVVNAQSGSTSAAGGLNENELGQTLDAMGLKPEKIEKRYDFAFKAVYKGEEWKLSMSTVLSQNEETIWVMAWLDQVPSSSADVPRMSLLRLLAANDRLGNGKFFAYIPTNKRFVLQRVVSNKNMTSANLRNILKDLGTTVIEEYPTWSVAGWKNADGSLASGSQNAGAPTRTSAQDPKYGERRIR